jgi:hypothetical protein
MSAEITSYSSDPVRQFSIFTENRIGRLHDLAALFAAEINIHYLYSFIKRPGEESALALHVEYPEEAARCLFLCGHTILGQHCLALTSVNKVELIPFPNQNQTIGKL